MNAETAGLLARSFIKTSQLSAGNNLSKMFRKRKNKLKQDILTVGGEEQENKPPNLTPNPDENINDEVDGFDSEGFVDLTSEEHQTKLLGPQQNCQYVGTFAVSLGSSGDGEATLTTHKERTKFVKKKLREYRFAEKGVKVALQISKDGIKTITPDGQRVRMAHALQRISFATCDPEFRLFAYMSHNPSPLGTAIHCHVFMTKHTREVQNLTALVGKAFQVAFAESKFPQGAELKMEPILHGRSEERVVQGRRWARIEAERGHEHSQHALMARIKKDQAKSQSKNPNTSEEATMPKESSVVTPLKTKASPLGRQRSFGKARTPPEVRRPNILVKNGVNDIAVGKKTNLSEDVVADSAFDLNTNPKKQQVKTVDGTEDVGEKLSVISHNGAVGKEEQHPLSAVASSEQEWLKTPPQPPKSDGNSHAVSMPTNLMMSPLAKSASDPNLLNSSIDNKHEPVSKRNSYEDENWYLAGIPREFAAEMLQNAEEGSFFVRDSQSQPGCFALTMRVPRLANSTGFGNFLICKVKDGVMIQGFDRVFQDVTSLVEHYSQYADGLPCKLLIDGSNVLCEDDDYVNMVPKDQDYQLLSDFSSMMAELN